MATSLWPLNVFLAQQSEANASLSVQHDNLQPSPPQDMATTTSPTLGIRLGRAPRLKKPSKATRELFSTEGYTSLKAWPSPSYLQCDFCYQCQQSPVQPARTHQLLTWLPHTPML